MVHNIPTNLVYHLLERRVTEFRGKHVKHEARVPFSDPVTHTET